MPEKAILIVEDNPQEAELMSEALSRGGLKCPITVLGSAEDLISYFEGRGLFKKREDWPLPSLILLDLKLPGRSGLEVLEWVREHAKWKTLPIVVFTSSRRAGDMGRSYAVGANSFIVKPDRFPDLIDVLVHTATYWLKYNLSKDL